MSPVSAFDFSLLIRLMMAARALAWAQFSQQSNGAGPPAPAVTVCNFCRHTQGGDDRSHHFAACKVGAVVAALAQLEPHGPAIRQGAADSIEVEGRPRTSPEQAGAGRNSDPDPDSLPGLAVGGTIPPGTAYLVGEQVEPCAVLSPAAAAAWRRVNDHIAAAVGDAPAGGDRGQVIGWPGAADGADHHDDALGYAVGDYGEPWHVDAADPSAVDTRDGREVFHAGTTELHEQDEQRFARRLAACVNLCASAPTEVLERAYENMTAQFPRWILIAVSAEHLTPAKLAELSQHIDAATAAGGRR